MLSVSILMLWASACSRDPHKLKITDENKDKFLESIRDSKGLTVEENRLLLAYMMRSSKALGVGKKELSPVGKTVGQLIGDEREWEALMKAEQQGLAQTVAKQDTQAGELRKIIDLTVVEKSFLPADSKSRRLQDTLVIKCTYHNNSNKDIRYLRGDIFFRDLFGHTIAAIRIDISGPIKAGEKKTWTDMEDYSHLMDRDKKLKDTGLKDINIDWRPQTVIFTDGSIHGGELPAY